MFVDILVCLHHGENNVIRKKNSSPFDWPDWWQEGSQTGTVTYFCKSRGHGFIKPSEYQVNKPQKNTIALSFIGPVHFPLQNQPWQYRVIQPCSWVGNPIIRHSPFFVCLLTYSEQNIVDGEKHLSSTHLSQLSDQVSNAFLHAEKRDVKSEVS